MRSPTYGSTLLLLLAAAAAAPLYSPPSALAQARLRSQGSSAGDLERVALKAEADIVGPFATTRMEITYRNESYSRTEADFEYVLPPDTLVSSFAYWYGDEKVTARVVDKERAAAIYKHITTRQRDPALIERIDERTFRARIFPVESGADLRVEMVFRQVLPSDGGGMIYHLPLTGTGEQPLRSIEARVRVDRSTRHSGIRNNLGIPLQPGSNGDIVMLAGTNYRPEKDLRVRIVRPAAALHTHILAAPSGGAHGFFALALTPSQAMAKPAVRLTGSVYDVHIPRRPLKAHQTLTITGRYRRSGPLGVQLSDTSRAGGYGAQARVELGGARIANSPAALLWASRELDRRERGGQRRSAIQLSKRFGLPGRFTSWLAVPEEERRRYWMEKDQERIAVLAESLGAMVRDGKEHTRQWKRLHGELDRLCKRSGRYASQELAFRVQGDFYSRVSEYLDAKYLNRSTASRLARLKAEVKRLGGHISRNAEAEITDAELQALHGYVKQEYARAKPDAARVRFLEQSFVSLHSDAAGKEYARLVLERMAVGGEMGKIAARLDEIRAAVRSQPEAIGRLEQRRSTLGERDERLRLELQTLEARNARLTERYAFLRARTGDPLISIEAPADALRVVALMPDGTLKPLTYRAESGRWEVRFDIPTYALEGGYTVKVIVVRKDGRRSIVGFTFVVDMTAPTAAGRTRRSPEGRHRIWVEIDAAPDTARVAAFAPGGEAVPLRRTAGSRYAGWVELPPNVPPGERVKVVVTDRAHNRTVLEVEPDPLPETGSSEERP